MGDIYGEKIIFFCFYIIIIFNVLESFTTFITFGMILNKITGYFRVNFNLVNFMIFY